MAILTQNPTAAQFSLDFFPIETPHRLKIGVFDGRIDLMHIERNFPFVVTAILAFRAQKIERFVARIAAFFDVAHSMTRDANRFVARKFRGIGLSALCAQKLATFLGFEVIFLEPAPHIDGRNADFFGDLRGAKSTFDERAQTRFIGRRNQFAHTPILN